MDGAEHLPLYRMTKIKRKHCYHSRHENKADDEGKNRDYDGEIAAGFYRPLMHV